LAKSDILKIEDQYYIQGAVVVVIVC